MKRTGVFLVVCGITGAVAFSATPASSAVIRTDTKLGGYTVATSAAPLKVLLDDPTLPIPRKPGSAVVEADPAYTASTLATGPNSHATSSTLWPGNLFGTGLAQVANGAPSYPVQVNALYPDKPYTASNNDQATLEFASALGLDAYATGTGVPKDAPGVLTVGGVSSRSETTVTTKDVATSTATSKVSDVDLVGGIVHLGSVSTLLTATSNGVKPGSSGTTTVGGLEVAGMKLAVDGDGVHLAGSTTPLPASNVDQLAKLGISISLVDQVATKTATAATRDAGGLKISIDTAPLRKMLNPVTGLLTGPEGTIIASLPAAAQGDLYYLVGATPNITFILGAASVSANAVKQLSFSFPTPPPIGPGGTVPVTPPQQGGGAPITSPVGTGTVPSVTLPQTSTPLGALVQPGAAPQLFSPPTTAATGSDKGFEGLGAGRLLAVLAIAGLAGWGLLRVFGLFGGVPLGPGCRLGAPTDLPNLRSVTA